MVVFDQSVTKSDKTMTMLLNSNDLVMFNFFIDKQKLKQNESLILHLHGFVVSESLTGSKGHFSFTTAGNSNSRGPIVDFF